MLTTIRASTGRKIKACLVYNLVLLWWRRSHTPARRIPKSFLASRAPGIHGCIWNWNVI